MWGLSWNGLERYWCKQAHVFLCWFLRGQRQSGLCFWMLKQWKCWFMKYSRLFVSYSNLFFFKKAPCSVLGFVFRCAVAQDALCFIASFFWCWACECGSVRRTIISTYLKSEPWQNSGSIWAWQTDNSSSSNSNAANRGCLCKCSKTCLIKKVVAISEWGKPVEMTSSCDVFSGVCPE